MKHMKTWTVLLAVVMLGAFLISTAGARVGSVTSSAVESTRANPADAVRPNDALVVWCDRFMKKRIMPKINELLEKYEQQSRCWNSARAFGSRDYTLNSGFLTQTDKCQKIDAQVAKLQKEGMALLERWRRKGCK